MSVGVIVVIAVFAGAYVLVIAEELLHLRKSIPVLLGAGVILSAIAYVVERVAEATAIPLFDRRISTRLSALAAAVMLIALLIYLAGQHHLPDPRPKRADRAALPPMTADERRRTWALLGLIALTIPANIAYPMIWNIGVIWLDQHVDLQSPFGAVPASWFNSIDAFSSIVVAAPLVALWTWQARRGSEPGNITKIAIGSAIVGVAALLFAAGSAASSNGEVPVLWALAGYAGRYRDPWYGDVVIGSAATGLTIDFTSTPRMAGRLIEAAGRRYWAPDEATLAGLRSFASRALRFEPA